ncbi:hypothetical protein QL848_002259 [Enterococcus faecium]|nr:hypothetical protein [Enterococcus faecium]
MLNVSKDFHLAFADSEREIFVKIYIKNKLYQKENVKNFEYSTGAFGGETFQIGSTQSATIKITFTEIIEGLKELDKVRVELGIKIRGTGAPENINNVSRIGHAKVGKAHLITYVPDKYEFVPLGIFYISNRVDPNRNENTTTIEARDGFLFLEGTYDSQLAYPTKVSDVALEIANLSGSIIDEESFSHLSKYVINKPEGYTYRQAIGLIGQFEAGFVCFDRYGNLAIRKLADPKFSIAPDLYFLNGLTKNELLYQPKGISCKVIKKKDESSNETTTLTAGLTSGPQINIENNIMTQSLLQMIYEKIKDLNFYPINLEWRGNPALEVGDWVTLIDRKGNKFKSPILGYTISFDGGIKSVISADTKSASANVVAYKGPLQQKLEEIDYRIDAAGKNNVYDGPEEPKYPKEGDIWFKKNGPDDEIWVYMQTSSAQFEWVMTTSTRMADEIKEKIENATPSEEIIKTINLSDEVDGKEWLKIKGAKLWLTEETKIDNAIITSAMIASVDAGSIRTGTLDASYVKVVNLTGKSLAAGTITADKLSANAIMLGFNSLGNTLQLTPTALAFYSAGNMTGRISEDGFEFWYGSRKIGRIGENSKKNNVSVRGIAMDLETTGDFITWGYKQNSTDDSFTTLLTLDPKGKLTGNSGVIAGTNLNMKGNYIYETHLLQTNEINAWNGSISLTKLPGEKLIFAGTTFNKNNYTALRTTNGHVGMMFGTSYLYFLHDNYVWPFEDIRKIVWTLKGLGTICLPTSFYDGGGVKTYKKITI